MNEYLKQKLTRQLKIFPEFSSILHEQAENLDKLQINSSEKHSILIKTIRYGMNKNAFPQKYDISFSQPFDTTKWVKAAENIYNYVRNGYDYRASLDFITKEWEEVEKRNFENWLSFYQQGAQDKYKTAQFYPASFQVSPDQLKATLPKNPELARTEIDKKELLRKKILGIIGRLNAAERLATDPEIRDILSAKLGIDLNQWLNLLHQLKRTVQTAPIKNIASSYLEDVIIKYANLYAKNGLNNIANELIFIAQVDPNSVPPPAPPATEAPKQEEKDPLDELIEGMNFDSNEIIDQEEDPLNIKILAQTAPINTVNTPASTSGMPNQQQTVDENISEEAADTILDEKTDDLFESALKNVTIHDVIARLEMLANLFRTREIPRQLAIIDLMMDKLNISSFFPSLAEASSKSLESNQYSLTRVEEILSKLRGVVKTPLSQEIDLVGGGELPTHMEPIANELEKQRNIEQAVKEKRKQNSQLEELNQQKQIQQPIPPELTSTQPQIQQTAPVVPAVPR